MKWKSEFTPPGLDDADERVQLAPPLFGYDVKLVPQPNWTALYCISDFRFRCLQRVGKQRDFTFWQQAESNVVRIAGKCHFAAIWRDNGKTSCSDIEQVLTIAKQTEVKLAPTMSLPE